MPEETPTESPTTALYRFIGHTTSIGPYTLNVFGQLVELPVDLAREAVEGGSALLPDDVFQLIGFTDAELEQWPEASSHAFIPDGRQELVYTTSEQFREKKHRALLLLHDYRQIIASPSAPAEGVTDAKLSTLPAFTPIPTPTTEELEQSHE